MLAARSLSFNEEFITSFRSDRLQLILLPTEQCNFRCTYCYEDFAIGKMPESVVAGVKHLIDRRAPELTHLQLSWFGGEPMLARSIMEDIARHALSAEARNPNLTYQSDATTNGFLLDGNTAEALSALHIRAYQVSLDGPSDLHDRTRVKVDGSGSFERIWQNLLSIKASRADVSILLRVHLTPDNLPAMPDFLAVVRDTFLKDSRFSIFLKRVVKLGGPNDDSMGVIDPDDAQIASLKDLILGAADRDRGNEDSGINGDDWTSSGPDPLFVPEDVCYAARANSLLIGADGRIGKCTVGLSDPANVIGHLLSDGSLQIDNDLLRLWLEGWETGDPELTACPYQRFTRSEPQQVKITRRPPLALAQG